MLSVKLDTRGSLDMGALNLRKESTGGFIAGKKEDGSRWRRGKKEKKKGKNGRKGGREREKKRREGTTI